MTTVYLNGEYMPIDKACVPVLDRGFIFGDGIYEVIQVFNGYLFRLEDHLDRLDSSLRQVNIESPLSREKWTKIIESLVEQNGGGHQSVYLQITRGVAKRDHVSSESMTPTVYVMSTPADIPAKPEPMTAITCDDNRWQRCDIKAIALLPNILLRQQAHAAGAWEAVLVRDDLVTEGAASNVFIVQSGLVKTPPKGPHLLPGITRDLILELLVENRISFQEADITAADLAHAEEIWLTSSVREIVPVVELDGEKVGLGKPGEIWDKVTDIFHAFKLKFTGN